MSRPYISFRALVCCLHLLGDITPTMAYNKGFNPDRLPMHAEPEQVGSRTYMYQCNLLTWKHRLLL